MREIPPIRYKKDAKKLVGLYKKAHSDVVKEMIYQLEKDKGEKFAEQESDLAKQLQGIIEEADEDILPEVERIISDSHKKGQARALLSLGDAKTLSEALDDVSFSLFARESVERMVEDTFEDVLAITDRTSKQIKKTVREASGEVLRMNAIKQTGYDTSRKEIMDKLLKEGFTKKVNKRFKGITDSAGRRWKLDSYVNMLVRTKMSQAYTEGVRTESIERGTDLALISSHGALDACADYEGMVISMTGATDGYLTYDDLRESNEIFHPNCEHTVTPLRELKLLPESMQEKHHQQMNKKK